MPTRDEWRQVLGPSLTEKEVDEFIAGIQVIINQVLDEYFREEFEPDDDEPPRRSREWNTGDGSWV